MNQLLEANPSTGAYSADPLTISEIDAHPDADRIWATLVQMRSGLDEMAERAQKAGIHGRIKGQVSLLDELGRELIKAGRKAKRATEPDNVAEALDEMEFDL